MQSEAKLKEEGKKIRVSLETLDPAIPAAITYALSVYIRVYMPSLLEPL